MDASVIGIAAALGSAASWALGSIMFKRLGDRLSPMTLTFAKGMVGVALLAVANGMASFEPVGARALALLALSGVLGIALGDMFFFMALRDLGAHAVVVLLTLGQVCTLLLAVLLLDERPAAQQWVGIALVVTGVSVVMWLRLRGKTGTTGRAGLAAGLAAVILMAISVIIAKEALAVTGSLQASLVRMLAGTLGILLLGLATSQLSGTLRPLREPGFAGFFVLSVAVVTFGGFWLSLLAIEKLDVTIANTLASAEPLFVLPLAAVVLHEKITIPILMGTGVAVLGIVMLVMS
jgi:drug/metabolite transporter (DMT)-like permease